MEEEIIYLCDIDGTLADISHRLHFIQHKPADWNSFFRACVDDLPIKEVIDTVRLLTRSGATILLLTGRSEIVLEETLNWLKDNSIPCGALFMREDGDHRQDNIVKGEFLDDIFEKWGKNKHSRCLRGS